MTENPIPKADEPDYDNPPYYRVGLVGCGKDKCDEPAPAKDLYTSRYFQLKREWCEYYTYRWFVVSAEHGLLKPDEVIEPYEQSLADLTEKGKQLWTDKLVNQLSVELSTVWGTPHSHEVVLLMGDSGGNDYRSRVREALSRTARGYMDEDEHAAIYSPFEEESEARGGNGAQMGWLREEVERAEAPSGQVSLAEVSE